MKELRAVEIEINSNCNMSCSYCPNVDQGRLEQGSMPKELFHKILKQLQLINYSGRVSFSFYNEPLLNQDLEYFSSEVKSYLPMANILIYTNGTMLTTSRLESLIFSGVDYFVVTKHENVNNYVFEKVYASLSAEFRKKYIKFQSYKDLSLTNRGGLIKNKMAEIETANLPCFIPMHMLTITNKGTVLPCFEDFHQKLEMGSILENSLQEIWNSTAYHSLRKTLSLGSRKSYEICSKCNRTDSLGIF